MLQADWEGGWVHVSSALLNVLSCWGCQTAPQPDVKSGSSNRWQLGVLDVHEDTFKTPQKGF